MSRKSFQQKGTGDARAPQEIIEALETRNGELLSQVAALQAANDALHQANGYNKNENNTATTDQLFHIKQLEKQLLESNSRFTAILESITDGFYSVNKKWMVTYWNKEAENLLNIKRENIVGHNLWEAYPRNMAARFYNEYHKAAAQNLSVQFEEYFVPIGKWLDINVYPSREGLSVYFKDITERKKAEEEIRSGEEKRRLIMNAALDAIICIDTKGTITFWNPQAEKIFGWKYEEVNGRVLSEIIIPEPFRAMHDKGIENYLKTGKGTALNVLLELSAINRSGQQFPIELTVLPIKQGEEDEFFCAFIRDITQRKKAEEAIRTSNERYDMVARATNDAIWDWDLLTNKVTRPGKRLETSFGYIGREADEVDEFWNTHAHVEDWARVTARRQEMFENPSQVYWEDEYRFLRNDGKYGFIYDRGYIIRDKDGKAIRMIGASQDVTKEKEQVNEILRIQQNLDSLINTTTDFIYSIDTSFKIITANKAFLDLLQIIKGRPVHEGDDILMPEIGEVMMNKWRDLFQRAMDGEVFDYEEVLHNIQRNDTLYMVISFVPIKSKDGHITGVACYAKDITTLKKSKQQLEKVNAELLQRAEELANSNTELERFAYVASHDLQEPLRMVSSFLQLLEKKYQSNLDEKAHQYIYFAVDGANRMKKLILDLLEYSRVGTKKEEPTDTDMNEVVKEVKAIFETKREALGAVIEADTLPVLTGTHKQQMLQLVQNLVGNALKYHGTQKPVIKITAVKETNHWLFEVKDNGIGINERFTEKVFVIFQRLHNKDEYSGTGIGLSICKKIVERYGGKIWVESEEGIGSSFYFTIPQEPGR